MAKAKKVEEKKDKKEDKKAAKKTSDKKPVPKSTASKTPRSSNSRTAKQPGTLQAGKPASKDKSSEKKKTDKKKEDVEIVEDGDEDLGYKVKAKPKLDKETKLMLNKKAEIAKRRPKFKRQEWFRYKKLGTKWRKPRGLTSKMRVGRKYRPPMATVGFRTPVAVRDYHPSGFKEVLVYNPRDLKDLDPKTQAARIGHSVGTRKREQIIKSADKMEIRVLNRGV